MIQTSIARRYARALFEAAGSDIERVGEELGAIAGLVTEDSPLGLIFLDPTADTKARRELIETIIAKAGLGPMTGNLLRLLDDRSRLGELPSIARAFTDLVDTKVGRLRATLTSAEPLPTELRDRLQDALGAATSRKVEVETAVDRSLLGGVVAQVGNFVYDGSLRSQLERLRRELISQA